MSFLLRPNTLHKKMKYSTKGFLSRCDQIRRKLRVLSHLLNKSVMENFLLNTYFWRYASFDVQMLNPFVYIFVVKYKFLPNKSVRESSIKLKIGMLYEMNNTYWAPFLKYLLLRL